MVQYLFKPVFKCLQSSQGRPFWAYSAFTKAQLIFLNTFVFLTLFFFYSAAWSTLLDKGQYEVYEASFSRIQNGDRVQGSASFGGLQPDYFIDLGSLIFREKLTQAYSFREKYKDLHSRLEAVRNLVASTLTGREYKDHAYLSLMGRYRAAGEYIPLSEYIKLRVGTCREYALLSHFLLAAAGIDNQYVYAKVYFEEKQDDVKREDHAFNVIKYKGEDIVFDSYSYWFHALKLKDLFHHKGVRGSNRVIQTKATQHNGLVGITEINSYPLVYRVKIKDSEGLEAKTCLHMLSSKPLSWLEKMTLFIRKWVLLD